MAEEELTEAERAEIKDILGYGSIVPESKQNVHTFLHNVATAEDTTKLGNLKEEEIGSLSNPIRSYKHLALFARGIMKKEELANFFNSNSEIVTSTSLSREGFLVDRAVVQKRELRDTTKRNRVQNKSWFKKKDDNSGEGGDGDGM
jgi:hypothetical protein